MSFTPKFVDLVRNFTAVQGSGPIGLGAVPPGYTGFADAAVAGDQFYYCVQGIDKPAEREVGRGTLRADGTISRQPIAGPPTHFTGGTKTVALVAAGEWFERIGKGGACASRAEMAAAMPGDGAAKILTEAGREGLFLFSSEDQSERVAADPAQGMTIAPASDASGTSGAWLRKSDGAVSVRWFGAIGDDAANDGPAFMAALSFLRAISVPGPYSNASPTLRVPFGRYFLDATTIDIFHTLILEGEGTGDAGGSASVLRWAAGTTGIRVQAHNTSGAGTVDPIGHSSGASTIIRNLMLKGGFEGSEGEHHGIHLKARAIIRECYITSFAGNGIHGWASAGSGNSTEGNINNFHIEKCWIDNCRNGLFLKGGDANAGNVIALNTNYNRQWGIWDSSFLGNSYLGCHASGNGTSNADFVTMVHRSGNWYYVLPGQAEVASVNAPSGTTADNQWWGWARAGSASTYVPTWTSGVAVRESGPYKSDNFNATSLFSGCYSESDQAPSHFVHPALILGGQLASGVRGDGVYLRNHLGELAVDRLRLLGDLSSTGNNSFIGPVEGAARDNGFSFRCTNYYNNLLFESYLGGAHSLDGEVRSARGFGLILKGYPNLELRHGASNATIASVEANSFNIGAGKTIQMAGVNVVGNRRTGWGAPTGSANRSSFGTASITTELLAERVKALIDDLTAHGLIGT